MTITKYYCDGCGKRIIDFVKANKLDIFKDSTHYKTKLLCNPCLDKVLAITNYRPEVEE